MEKKMWLGKIPEKCDICGSKLETVFIDGKTCFGPWANMCPRCHLEKGVGLGTGRGQKYDVKTKEKIGG